MKKIGIALAALTLAACASAPARPVLYPNAKFKQAGDAVAQKDVDECIALAESSGASPTDASRAVRPAAEGAAVGGAVGGVSRAIRGGHIGEGAIAGAAIGGTAGAVHGAFRANEASPLYKSFVQRCLRERGYDVIGWK